MNSPLVSVIMSTYNHEDFVRQAIESVLQQENIDLEFLIADDGSVDRTRDMVSSIRDSRIRFYPNLTNRGACVVTNELISRASGKFIALINSDDYWLGTNKLTSQVEILNEKPEIGACFGRARFIDKDGAAVDRSSLTFGNVFEQKNRPRGAWLRRFFDLGNCICHPTMLIRKSCYENLGMYDNRLRQLPDFDMWVRLVKKYEIYISDDELIAFRHLPGENVSSDTVENRRRVLNELYLILQRFFVGVTKEIFLDGFGDLLVKVDQLDKIHMDIEQSLLYLNKNTWASHIFRLIGLEKLHFLLGCDSYRSILNNHYGIDDRALHSISSEIGVFDIADPKERLSIVHHKSLIAELKQRLISRSPMLFRPLLNRALKLL